MTCPPGKCTSANKVNRYVFTNCGRLLLPHIAKPLHDHPRTYWLACSWHRVFVGESTIVNHNEPQVIRDA